MKKNLLTSLVLCAGAGLLSLSSECMAYEIVAPGNLNAKVNGMVVDLTWDWGNAGRCVHSESFEGEAFPPAGWQVKNTNAYDEAGNWGVYDFSEEAPDMYLCHDGVKGAIVIPAGGDDDEPSTYHQDEWLIVKPGAGAAYMDFWYYLHPSLLDVGGIRDFPDHYYVKVSFDNGESWEELWDGRWDIGNVDGPRQASLFLGDDADEDTLVAFQAVGGENESIYYTWIVDDVQFYTSEDKAATRGSEEWLNNGNVSYRVYLDGEKLFDFVKARYFTDYSTKEPGKHVYKVAAWSEAMDEEYEAAEIEVNVGAFTFPTARNLQVGYEEQNGKYLVTGRWDAPEGDLQPAYYNVYINGKSAGWIDTGNELSMGQSGLYKGVYTIEVQACYQFPEGVSEKIGGTVYAGTIPAPGNLRLEETDSDIRLGWNAPDTMLESAPDGYRIYRGDELIADLVAALEYVDKDVPAGAYTYSVHAVYSDGGVSLPSTAARETDELKAVATPLVERFDNGHLPAGWDVTILDPNDRIKDMYSWRFDNWFDAEIPADSGMERGFASVNGLAAGMNRLESYLCSPIIALSASEPSVVRFIKYFAEEKQGPTGPAAFKIEISEDGGDSFVDLADLRSMENGEVSISLEQYLGKEVMLRWGFLGRNSGFAAVDFVRVEDKTNAVDEIVGAAYVFDVFSVDGGIVAKGVQADSLEALPAGIYLLHTSGGETRKFLKK